VSVQLNSLVSYLDELLASNEISDYCPNGLQVEGASTVKNIVTGVTASQALIDTAIAMKADAILVHHGYFWKGERQPITGMKKTRIKALLDNDISLIGYHLPLDVHPKMGNNAQLGKLLGVDNIEPVSGVKPKGVLMKGTLAEPCSHHAFISRIENVLGRKALGECVNDRPISSVAWCTGGGQGFIEQAVEAGVDAFVTGEVSEQTIHVARECGIHFFSAGHHATERYGVKALGEHLSEQLDVTVQFVDIPNPA